jgi:hypothetical protein
MPIKYDTMVNDRRGKGLAHFCSYSHLAEEEAPYRFRDADCRVLFVPALPYAFFSGFDNMQKCSPQSGDYQAGNCIVFHQDI